MGGTWWQGLWRRQNRGRATWTPPPTPPRPEPAGRDPDGLFRAVCAGGDMAGLGVWSPDWRWQNLHIGPGIENTVYAYDRGLWLPEGWTYREGRDWLRMELAVAMEQDDGTLTLGPKFRFPAALAARWGLPE